MHTRNLVIPRLEQLDANWNDVGLIMKLLENFPNCRRYDTPCTAWNQEALRRWPVWEQTVCQAHKWACRSWRQGWRMSCQCKPDARSVGLPRGDNNSTQALEMDFQALPQQQLSPDCATVLLLIISIIASCSRSPCQARCDSRYSSQVQNWTFEWHREALHQTASHLMARQTKCWQELPNLRNLKNRWMELPIEMHL